MTWAGATCQCTKELPTPGVDAAGRNLDTDNT